MRWNTPFAVRVAVAWAAVLVAAPVSPAQTTYYWDSNGATAGFGTAAGTWGTSSFWSTDSTGASATSNPTILATDDINFGTATNGYTGTVTLSGTQTANSVTVGSASGAVTIGGGTAFNLGNANTVVTQNSGSALTVSSAIGGGTNGLTKAGAGTLILSGNNTYSGGFTLNAGTVQVSAGTYTGFGTGTLTINGGTIATSTAAAFTTANNSVWNANFTVARGITGVSTWTHNGNVTLGANVAVSSANNGWTAVMNGTIGETGGSRSLTLAGNTLTFSLNAANTYSGGTVLNSASGQININNAAAIGTGILTFAAAGRIDNTSGSALTLVTNNAQAWNSNFTFVGTNDLNLGTGAVTLNATRTVTITGGTLTVGGNISGTGFGLTKAGAGTLTLTGSGSTYTGATAVSGGTLLVNGNQSAATGAVTVAAGATLGGTGTVGGATTVQSGGALAPGAGGSGALNVGANTVLAGGAAYAFELSAAGGAAGSGTGGSSSGGSHDLLAVTGTLTLTGSTVNVFSAGGLGATGLDAASSYSWRIATATGGITGTPTLGTVTGSDFAAYTAAGGVFDLSVSGNSLYLNLTPAPEPASVLGIGVGAFGLAAFVRHRRGRRAAD